MIYMKELFNTQLPGGEQPDIELCIFPHLKEFLVIDLRDGKSSGPAPKHIGSIYRRLF